MKMYVGFPVIDIHHQFGSQEQRDLHSTVAFWDDVTNVQCNEIAKAIADLSAWKMYYRKYRLVKHLYPNLFGENEDIPVLMYDGVPYQKDLQDLLVHKYGASDKYLYNPHITVDLKQAWPPLEEVLFLPIHMWRGKNKPRPIVR